MRGLAGRVMPYDRGHSFLYCNHNIHSSRKTFNALNLRFGQRPMHRRCYYCSETPFRLRISLRRYAVCWYFNQSGPKRQPYGGDGRLFAGRMDPLRRNNVARKKRPAFARRFYTRITYSSVTVTAMVTVFLFPAGS